MKKTFTGFVLLQLLFAFNVYAEKINRASVEYSAGVYTIDFDAIINAPQKNVYSLLTDYNHLNRLNDNITESTLLVTSGSSMKKFRLLLHTCLMFFCHEAVLLEEVNDNDRDQITTVIDPDNSDFKSGHSVWKVLPVGTNHTNILLYQKLEPGFWYPPVIGPWLVKKKMIKELTIMLSRVEQLASDTTSR